MKILIAGGGTGGHVYPAVAIAKAVLQKDPAADIQFVGTSRGVESKIIPRENFKLHLIEIGRLNSNVALTERLKTLITLPFALLKAAALVWRLKPDVVLGVGGYVSGPTLLAAALLKKKTVIWEPNAYPGLANRLLSRFVDTAIVVFEKSKDFMAAKKYLQIAMPIRQEIEEAAAHVPFTADFCILVFGGSQGARAINNAVASLVESGGPWLSEVRMVHQTGPHDFESVKQRYEQTPNAFGRVECLEYLHDMPARYAWADLVICRSGTGTLSELSATGKPAILIPLPTAADDHQTENAKVLAAAGAAVLLPQKEMQSTDKLATLIRNFKAHPEELERISQNIRRFHQPRAAAAIADVLMEGATNL